MILLMLFKSNSLALRIERIIPNNQLQGNNLIFSTVQAISANVEDVVLATVGQISVLIKVEADIASDFFRSLNKV